MMTGDSGKPLIQPWDIFSRYCVAVASAWTAELVTYPFDMTKTRLQIQSEVAATKAGYKLEYKGMISTAIGIAQKEGVLKLWSGLIAMLQRHSIYSGCRLVIYEHLRDEFKDENGHISLVKSCVGGFTAGGMAQFIASPTDLVKVQMQAEGRRVVQGLPPRFANIRQAYAKLYSEGGFLGFWRGAIPSVQRAALVNMGELATYDFMKNTLGRKLGLEDNALLHGCSAIVAGLTAAILGTPADVLKTRLMIQPVGPDGRGKLYRGMIDCFKQSVRNEGILSLYQGFVPIWLRLGPCTLINWLVFEHIMIALGERTF